MKRPILLLALAATLCATQNLFAWGRLGHATVARIAEEHLTKKARANLDKWLDGESIVYYASWLDDYKPQMLVQLLCTGSKWVDFVSYDPRLSGAWSPAKLFIVRYEPTQDELNAALEQCEAFLAEVKTRFDALAKAVIKGKVRKPKTAKARPDDEDEEEYDEHPEYAYMNPFEDQVV